MAKPSAQEKFLDDRRPDLERRPEREGEAGWNRSPRPLGRPGCAGSPRSR
jgi:hypothetical protein